MNKLAMLAFTLLVFLSIMLWYLAKGSLNEYINSQIELQGHYYSGQKASVMLGDFSANTSTGEFKKIRLLNLKHHQAKHAVIIDIAHVELLRQPSQHLLTTINKITLNKLILNIENNPGKTSNIEQLIQKITAKLALDYPQLYPEISAKIYAKNNPQLNAEEYAKNHPQVGAGAIIELTKAELTKAELTKAKKKRSRFQEKIKISAIAINTLELNIVENGITKTIQFHDVNITAIGGEQGIVTNQVGGEVLLALLNLATYS